MYCSLFTRPPLQDAYNDLIGAAFLKHFKFMHLEQWQRYPLNMVNTDIIDEQGENVIHKCVRYDKIDFLKHIPSI